MKVKPLPAAIPCKHCGSVESSMGMTDDDEVYVQCENLNCLARGPLASSPRDAVAKWNATIKVLTGWRPGLGIRAMSVPPYDPEIPPIDYLNHDTKKRDILAADAALRRHRDAAAVLEDAPVLSKDMMKKFTISPDDRLKDFNYVAGPSGPETAAELEEEDIDE